MGQFWLFHMLIDVPWGFSQVYKWRVTSERLMLSQCIWCLLSWAQLCLVLCSKLFTIRNKSALGKSKCSKMTFQALIPTILWIKYSLFSLKIDIIQGFCLEKYPLAQKKTQLEWGFILFSFDNFCIKPKKKEGCSGLKCLCMPF